MEKERNIGVTGIHVASGPKSGAVVLKELAIHKSIRPFALVDYPQTCALGWSDFVAGVFMVPQGIAGEETYAKRLEQICRNLRLDAVLPCDDEDVLCLAGISQRLSERSVATLLPSPDVVEAVKKERLGLTLAALGIESPPQIRIDSLDEAADARLTFPAVVKGRLIYAYLAKNRRELIGFVEKLAAVWGFPVVLQEFRDGAEFSVAAVADRQSNLRGVCAIRKQGISEQGKTWRAVTIEPSAFLHKVSDAIEGLRWAGPMEIEFIADSDGGNPFVIEINPRLPAWIPVSRHAGADLAKLVADLCTDEAVDDLIEARPGVCFARTYCTGTFAMSDMAKLFANEELVYAKRKKR